MLGGPRIVIVHDYLTQRGGAERVALDLLRTFPGSRLVTSCWNPATTYPGFHDHDIETLWIDKVPALRRDPRRAFPVLAKTFERHTIRDADVVVCSSSGWAHRVGTSAPKVVYCHNPARWLYQPNEYFPSMPGWARRHFVRRTAKLRHSDAEAAHDAAAYLVNSGAVAGRVRVTYGIDPTVVPPARGLSPEGPKQPVPGIEPGYLLTVSRRRAYKQTQVICEAVASMPGERLVVVGGGPTTAWPVGVKSVSNLDDAQMRWLYAHAAGLVAVAHEDFGLTPVEAQSFGIPAVVLRNGGYLDSTVEDLTGVFIDSSSVPDVIDGIRALRRRRWDADALRRCGDRYAPNVFAERMTRIVEGVLSQESDEPSTSPMAPVAEAQPVELSAAPQPLIA
jgi:glycosyltransferase involved in cell wall biosynthesis